MANGGYGYGRAYGAQALGQGLLNIGRMLAGRRESEERRKLLEAAQTPPRADLRTAQLAEPGAIDLPEYLQQPGAEIAPGSLQRIGRAEETEVPITFIPPPREPVRTPEGVPLRVGDREVMLPEDRPVVTPQGVVQRPREARQARMAETIATRQAETPSRPEVLAGREREALTTEEKQQQYADIVAKRLGTAPSREEIVTGRAREALTPEERAQRLADIGAEASAEREPISAVEARARAQAQGAGLLDQRTGAEKGKPTWNQAFSALQEYYYDEYGALKNPNDPTAPASFDALDRMARAVVSGTVPAQKEGEMARLGQIVQQYTAGMNRGPGAAAPGAPVTVGAGQTPPPTTAASTKTEVSQAQFDTMIVLKQEEGLSAQDARAFVAQQYRVKQP
jgi:hypothetical protein